MKKLYVLLCIVLCFHSCKTVPKGNRDKVYYEYNEKGVPQYAVMIYDPKTDYVTYITTHVNGNSIVWMKGRKFRTDGLLGYQYMSSVVLINGLSLDICSPSTDKGYDLTYLIDEEKNGGSEIYFVGVLPTDDRCIVPHKADFFPRKLKRTTGIDYNRFWPPHHDVINALNEDKFREARVILLQNVREEGKRQDEKQRRILERLKQEQDSTKKE
ncbi:hypothetical protein AAG747_17370 [Rapidithrix thailandica]|uniref:Lipoprotein n=1 Tax=Rapidithrix thailandica TaxID=413964 RepID=A0AAW9S872_9BACT